MASPLHPNPFSSFSQTLTFLDLGASSDTGGAVNGADRHYIVRMCSSSVKLEYVAPTVVDITELSFTSCLVLTPQYKVDRRPKE